MAPFQKTISIETAIADVQDGSVLMFGGFGESARLLH